MCTAVGNVVCVYYIYDTRTLFWGVLRISIHLFIYSYIRSPNNQLLFIHASSIYPYMYLYMYLSIPSFLYSSSHISIHIFIHLVIYLSIYIFIHPVICIFILSSITINSSIIHLSIYLDLYCKRGNTCN